MTQTPPVPSSEELITDYPPLPGYAVSPFDEIPIYDVSASETKKMYAEAFILGVLDQLPPGSIDGNLIFNSQVPQVGSGDIADGSITAAKLADNSSIVFSSTLPISGEFVGQGCMLSNGSFYVWSSTGSWVSSQAGDLLVTADNLGNNSSGVWLNEVGTPDAEGSFTGQIAVDSNGVGYMWTGSEWIALSAEVADGSVTGAKLADNSSAVFYTEGTDNIQGEFIGQLAIDDAEGNAYAWTGTEWISLTSADSYTGTTGDVVNIEIDNNTREISAVLADTTDASQFLAGPTDAAGAASYRAIVSEDLPLGDGAVPGVVASGTLIQVSNGIVDLPASIESNEEEYHLVAYNEYGIITASAALTEAVVIPPATETDLGGVIVGEGLAITGEGVLSVDFDANTNLPIANDTDLGGVIIGGGIAITSEGVISINNTFPTPGTYSKLTVDSYGLCTAGDVLLSDDIPDLDASKITTGSLDPNRIADGSIARRHLGDYSITFIQETAPTLNVGAIGLFWLKESNGALYVYNGNRWVSVAGGSTSGGGGGGTPAPPAGQRYGGIVDGSTGLISAVTTEGLEAGFSAASALEGIVTDDNVGLYFIVNPAGDQIAVVSGQATSVGDWILATSPEVGWTWVDRSGTGSGGVDPSTITLADLADVQADTPVDGDCLIYNQTDGVYQTRHIDINELGDVAVNTPEDNQVLTYTSGSWVNAAAPSGGAISTDAPSDGKQYARQNEGWSEIVIPGLPTDGQIPTVSETPPASPTAGMIWVRPSTLRQYVYMTDEGGSSQWASVMCC